MDEDAIDFVVAAWREDGRWRVSRLPKRAGADIDQLITALRAHPSEAGVLGLLSIAEEFFVIVRVDGARVRYLLSDLEAAIDWPLAADVLENLGLPLPDEDDLEELTPAGDLTLLADLGMSATELAILTEDIEMYPDEVLSAVTARLGFGDEFDQTID